MNFELSNHVSVCQSKTRPKCTILSQIFKKNLTRVAHQKFWVSPRGRKKDLGEGPQSLNMVLKQDNVQANSETVYCRLFQT